MVPRNIKQIKEEIDSTVPVEMSAADAYRYAIAILTRELRAYDDIIWRPLTPEQTQDIRAGRRRLETDIAVLTALYARQQRVAP